MRWVKGWFLGGSDELGWDDLIRRATDAIVELARYGTRGRVTFPPEVEVRIVVAEGSVDVIRGFVEKPDFDRQVRAAAANRCDCEPSALPLRSYQVAAGTKTEISVWECASERTWSLGIHGGDLDGTVHQLPRGMAELRFGRGPWHGNDRQIPNDLVLCEKTEFVSRRAGRLFHAGAHLEVESLDQGDHLQVRRASGETVRPARTASGRVALREDDVIELVGAPGEAVRLVLGRKA